MSQPQATAPRCLRTLSFISRSCLVLIAMVSTASAHPSAAAASLHVLVGFKRPAFTISSAARASILTRTREKARIAGLRGQVERQFQRADALVATLPADAVASLRSDPSVAYVEEDRPVHLLQSLPGAQPPTPPQLTPELIPWGIGGDDQTAGVRALISGADGDGVNVGVLDTGIGPHPDVTVVGGHNFVANTDDYSDDVGHGTHVAGTIAALRNGVGVVGVAPKARLYALKVLDSRGSGRTSWIIAGLEWAISHHLKVLNMSYGADQASETEHRAIAAAAQAGIVLVAASGNNGGAIGYPAAYLEVIAVGAVDSTGKVPAFSSHGPELSFVAPGVGILSTVPMSLGYSLAAARRNDGDGELAASGIRFSAATPAAGVSGPVRFAGRGTIDDVAAVDLKGAVALMERGDLSFGEKVTNAAAAGAVGALIFNNVSGSYAGTLGSSGAIPALSLSREAGLALKNGSGAPVQIYVERNALYTRFTGTSMACPHVTGIVALLLSVRPDLDPAGVRMILRETATDLGDPGRDALYGDGLVNAAAAIKAARANPAMP